MPTPPFAVSQSGHPLNVGDLVTVNGQITSISGSGNTATITITLQSSGNSVNVQAKDCGASTQTL